MQALTGKQSRHLRALAHELQPVVLLGKEGASEGVVQAVDQALTDHELIKVRLPEGERDERAGFVEALTKGTKSAHVGTIGRVVILYRRHPNDPKIVLPRK